LIGWLKTRVIKPAAIRNSTAKISKVRTQRFDLTSIAQTTVNADRNVTRVSPSLPI